MSRAGRFYLSRFLMLLGMGTLVVGLIHGVQTGDSKTELALLGVGVVLFFAGRLVDRPGR